MPCLAEFVDPWLGNKVNSGIGLSCRPVSPGSLAGRYNNPMPELTLPLQSGSMNSATGVNLQKFFQEKKATSGIERSPLLLALQTHSKRFRHCLLPSVIWGAFLTREKHICKEFLSLHMEESCFFIYVSLHGWRATDSSTVDGNVFLYSQGT